MGHPSSELRHRLMAKHALTWRKELVRLADTRRRL
jgi:hypothetical protein